MARLYRFVFLACCAGVFALCGASLWDDPCHFMTSTTPNDDDSQVVQLDIPGGCKNGTLEWHYPRGTLRLSMTMNHPFIFCIRHSWATYYSGIVDVTDGQDKKMPMPAKGDPTCVKSVNNRVVVALLSEDTQYYMTSVDYFVQ